MGNLIGLLVVGLVAGWIASRLMGSRRPGLFGLLIVGVLGSFVGGFLFQLVGFVKMRFPASLIPAVVGAAICIAAIRRWGNRF